MNKQLRFRDKVLQKEIKDKVHEILSPVFTIGQINKLLHPEKTVIKWNSEDIASAIALRSISPRGYRYLRNKNFPLSTLSTLWKKADALVLDTGVIQAILNVMENKGKELPEHEKRCILSFDEIYISQDIEIDRQKEQKIKLYSLVWFGDYLKIGNNQFIIIMTSGSHVIL